MPGIDMRSGVFTDAYWKSLRYFNLYRFCIAGLLFTSSILHPSTFSIFTPSGGLLHLAVTTLYLLATTFSLIGLHYYRRHFNVQLSFHVLVDIAVFVILSHVGGGIRAGLAAMLLVTLAGAGLVGQGRLVLFYAATATLAVLLEHSVRALIGEADISDFFQAGLLSAGFFGVAGSASLLARRVVANEELARRRGVALRNQTVIGQRVIEGMQDGVLVIGRDGLVKQHNPCAEQLLGLSNPSNRKLVYCSTELAQGFSDWCERESDEQVLVRAPASGMHLRARFVATESSERDVLVFLEDMSQVQEQARQLKLAALGRLTANIAHEIRNPLSAINHAGELLQEEMSDPTSERLLRIILDNARRVERIVSEVLELGRRDRAVLERVDLREALPSIVEEYALKETISSGIIKLDIEGEGAILFDRSHFYQVTWNLIGNALRHSRGLEGSVTVKVRDGTRHGVVDIHVVDDGEGVDEKYAEQIFEPFFTTHNRGTGLGLYIARELCEANGAQLDLVQSDVGQGADFRIAGGAVS